LTTGLVRDDETHYAQRLKLWEEFNTCWLSTLQKQKTMTQDMISTGQRPQPPQTLIDYDTLEKMGTQLVKNCDNMEKHGLVDYQMGVNVVSRSPRGSGRWLFSTATHRKCAQTINSPHYFTTAAYRRLTHYRLLQAPQPRAHDVYIHIIPLPCDSTLRLRVLSPFFCTSPVFSIMASCFSF
jgi:hypothetical protein